MRLLVVLPYYPPDGGGLEQYAHHSMAQLARSGHHVEAVAASTSHRNEESDRGVQVHFYRPTLRVGNAPVRPGLARALRRRIAALRPDVVMAHTPVPFPAEAAAHAAYKEEVPFVLTYHAGRLRGSSPPLEALAKVARATTQPRLLERSDHLIAVSRYVRETALREHRSRTTVIPPGVDTATFRPGGGSDDKTILFVGPLDRRYRWKGVDVLWQAFEALRRDGVEARLRLVGGGDRSAAFQARAACRSDVQVDGRLSPHDLVRAYQDAAVTVLPSTSDAESFGMVLAEANACGRPVVGSDIGGIPDFIRRGHNGELVPPGDFQALAQQLASLLQAPERMDVMGARGRQLVETEHTWGAVGRRTERVLEDVR